MPLYRDFFTDAVDFWTNMPPFVLCPSQCREKDTLGLHQRLKLNSLGIELLQRSHIYTAKMSSDDLCRIHQTRHVSADGGGRGEKEEDGLDCAWVGPRLARLGGIWGDGRRR